MACSHRVGFVGLGRMGWHMAARLQQRFPPTVVHSRRDETCLQHSAEFGTRTLRDWSDLKDVDFMVTCLPTSADVSGVLDSAKQHLRPGTIVVDCTSGDPDVTLHLGEALGAHGIHLVDAPLSGGPSGAEAGRLSVMVGGDEAVVERCQPLWEPLASTVTHVGGLSAGHAIKAVNNAMATVSLLVASEGLAALKRRGVDVNKALPAINASSGGSWMTKELVPKQVLTRNFSHGFSLKLMHKDLSIAQSMACKGGEAPQLMSLSEEALRVAMAQYGREGDLSEIAKLYEQMQEAVIE